MTNKNSIFSNISPEFTSLIDYFTFTHTKRKKIRQEFFAWAFWKCHFKAKPLPYTHIIRPSLDLRVQPVLVLVPEGRVAHQEDVEDDAARPDVHGLPVGLLLKHLGGEVAGGAGETWNGNYDEILD